MKKTVAVFIWLLFAIPCQARIITVDDDGPADFNNIQAAIDNANNEDEIEVAPGTYYEAIIFNGEAIRGKAIRLYSSGGPDVTTIDGTGFDHVVKCISIENANIILEGFTITGGDANGLLSEDREGGGMYNHYSSPTVINCTFSGNTAQRHGGGMYNHLSHPIVSNCTFSGNTAESMGGGMLNYQCSPIVTHCIFTGNNTKRSDGGGMFNFRGSPKIINCTFSGNMAGDDGGAFCNFESSPVLIHCILWGNKPDERMSFFATVTYSDVEGGTGNSWFGTGCIDVDPCFVGPGYWDQNGTPEDANDDFWVDGDYHLKSQAGRWDPDGQTWVQDNSTSPCIDTGDPLSPIGLEPFPNGGFINMGAYGGADVASKSYFGRPVCETIVAGDINGDCKINFWDFRLMALHWLQVPLPLLLPPDKASNPNPANYSQLIDINTDLSWTAGSNATSHDVYFGTSNPPPFIGNQISTTFDPGTLVDDTRHYWRIDEVNKWFTTFGTTWSFATGYPVPPPPPPP